MTPIFPTTTLIGAAALFSYIVGLSALARHESALEPGPRWPIALVWVPFIGTLPMISLSLGTGLLAVGVAGWMGYSTLQTLRGTPPQVRGAISLWIAGISLLDTWLIVSQGRLDLALYAVMGCVVTAALHRWVQGT
jgi:hypothetical protein